MPTTPMSFVTALWDLMCHGVASVMQALPSLGGSAKPTPKNGRRKRRPGPPKGSADT
jgi:hypothetical protein